MDANTFLDAALALYDLSIPSFPVNRESRTPFAGTRGFKDATDDIVQLHAWAEDERFADAIAAYPTGEASGWDVLDLDRKNGKDGLEALQKLGLELPSTFAYSTRSGGAHYVFKRGATPITNTASQIAEGVDTRGDGGYCAAWWLHGCEIIDNSDPAEAPEWLVKWFQDKEAKRTQQASPPPRDRGTPYTGQKLGYFESHADPLTGSIREGGRNNELARRAGIARKKGLDDAALTAGLHELNATRCDPPLPDAEVEKIAQSACRFAPGVPADEHLERWKRDNPLPPRDAVHEGVMAVLANAAAAIVDADRRDEREAVTLDDFQKRFPGSHLLRFVDRTKPAPAPDWLLPGFLPASVIFIAGRRGAGKTSSLVPLIFQIAGVRCWSRDLDVGRDWRHVVVVSEDTNQFRAVEAAAIAQGQTPEKQSDTRHLAMDRIHLVEAKRVPVEEFVRVGSVFRKLFSRTVDGLTLEPVIVLDTFSANLEMKDENSNSEGSQIISQLKTGFGGCPVLIIGHTPKGDDYDLRGAGSMACDAHGTMVMVEERGRKLLKKDKIRAATRWDELVCDQKLCEVNLTNRRGDPELTRVWINVPTPPEQVQSTAQQTADQKRASNLEDAILGAIWTSHRDETSLPLGLRSLHWTLEHAGVKCNLRAVHSAVDGLLHQRKIVIGTTTAEQREALKNPQFKQFYVPLPEHITAALEAGVDMSAEMDDLVAEVQARTITTEMVEAENERLQRG